MKTLVISDLHLGVQRNGGTTLASAAALRDYGHAQHRKLLALAPANGCKRVIVNGDLSDVYDIPLSQALQIYADTDSFLNENDETEVVWGLGNHDLSKDSSKLGTVSFIGALLSMKHKRFTLLTQPAAISADTYLIPHVPNQDLFDLELTKIPESTKFVLLHCNFDNKFACDADHSLDLSRSRAKELKARGFKLIFGHEHQGRESLGGGVVITGNQFPSSIADCLPHGDGQKGGTKRALILEHNAGELEFIQTWTPNDAEGWYTTCDWRELKDLERPGRGFIRAEGSALRSEAADVVKAVSAFRQRSDAFVVTNAVKVEQAEGLDDVAESIEDIRSINVLEMLLEHLDPKQREAVQALYETSEETQT